MARHIQNVGELRALIARYPDETPIAVMATPDITGYANNILAITGKSDEIDHLLLALAEETITEDEVSSIFTDEDGDETRPV